MKKSMEEVSQALPVSVVARLRFAGDEGMVWAAIASGELKATVLVEVEGRSDMSARLSPTVARKFLAGDLEAREVRQLPIPPAYSPDGHVVYVKSTERRECVMRASTVMVNFLGGGTGPVKTSQRQDALSVEIDSVIARLGSDDPKVIWNELRLRASRQDSAVVTAAAKSLEWKDDVGQTRKIDFDAFRERLRRRSNPSGKPTVPR